MATRRFVLLLTLLALALSGCAATPAEPASSSQSSSTATQNEPSTQTGGEPLGASARPPQPSQREEVVYAHDGGLLGVNPPHPLQYGPVAKEMPLARSDTFAAPAGTTAIRLDCGPASFGVGYYRLEVFGPDEGLVFSTGTWYEFGPPVGGGGGNNGLAMQARTAPGDHRIDYYVLGAFDHFPCKAIATIVGSAA